MLTPDALKSLREIVDRKRLITDPGELVVYEIDATQERGTPDAVVFVRSAQELAQIVRWAAQMRVPLVARGAGTGLSGGTVPDRGGLVVEFSRLDRIVELDTVGRSVTVEPGVINLDLDAAVKAQGLYYPPDPASGRSSTIGGNVAENAGGPHCFKYGVTSNYVTGLEAVLADGRVVAFGGGATDYPGYDLTALVTGSEGTLALITRMHARLIRNAPGVKTMMAAFDSVKAAGRAVSAMIAAGLLPATLELMDQKLMRIIEDFVHPGLPVTYGAMLIIEVDGFPASLDAQMDEIVAILERQQAHELRIAKTEEERAKIWYGRKSAAGCMARMAPAYFLVDGTVPRSRLADALDEIDRVIARLGLVVGYVAHAGDGNLHPFIPFVPSDKDQVARGWQACEEIMRTVIALEGSITGEHGIGIEKREFMPLMFNGAELAAMRDVKQVFDPHDLLNPGKMFPKDTPTPEYAPPLVPPPAGEFVPRTAQEAAAGLAALTQARQPVSINARRPGAVTLSTQNLCGIIRCAPDDLYITVGAGTPLEQVQEFLAPEGRQVPLVSPWRETTVGAIVSVNLNSPQRMRYGAVRDVLLCATVALADGRLIRAGRAVVKNVAGYDLPKVFVGAYGTLGVLTDITFKLMPLPRGKRTLIVPLGDLDEGVRLASRLLQVAMTASAVVIVKGLEMPGLPSGYALAYTAEGMAQDVETELNQVGDVLAQAHATAAGDASFSGTDLWCKLMAGATPQSLNVRVGVAPRDLGAYVQQQAGTMNRGAHLIDAASGLVYAVAAPESAGAAQAWLEALRRPARELGGYATATFVPEAWRETVDRWGYSPDTIDLMRALKARWDPSGILGEKGFIV